MNATQIESEKSKKKSGGVAIGYTYDDDGGAADVPNSAAAPSTQPSGNESDDSDSDIDVDVAIDISKMDTNQAHDLNNFGRNYGMQSNDFYSFLTKDADEAEALRIAREEEQEKIMLCGRKSRRERRAQRERRVAGRPISPPSYAAKEEPSAVRMTKTRTTATRGLRRQRIPERYVFQSNYLSMILCLLMSFLFQTDHLYYIFRWRR